MAIADREGSGTPGRGKPPLVVTDVDSGSIHTLILAGELDLSTAGDVETVIVACAERGRGLTLDLSELTFMDSTGLRLVLFAQQLCQANATEFALIPGPRSVQRVFELTGLLGALPFQREPTN